MDSTTPSQQQQMSLLDILLQQLPISQEELKILQENGFDDLESFKFLDLQTAQGLGLKEAQRIIDVIAEFFSQFEEEEEGEQEYEYDGQQHIIGEEMDEEDDQDGSKLIENQIKEKLTLESQTPVSIDTNQNKQPKVINQALILQILQQQQSKISNSAAAQYNKNMKGHQLTQALQKLTHLHLNGKKIEAIGEDIQKSCQNLKVLYLFDNMIRNIEGLFSLKNLIQLSLYNNQIIKMEGLEGLTSLRKLYLEKNKISRLEGLTNCTNLEELYLSKQDIDTDFSFDEYSLAAIAGSLKYLDLSDSRVVESRPLYYLERLDVLILKKNRISDFEEHVCPLLQTMSNLRELDLSDNPVNHIPKYRDQLIILSSNRLQEIDNKKVTQQERSYLMQLVQRKQRQVIGQEKKEEYKHAKTVGVSGGQFEIQGKNKMLHQQTEINQNQDRGNNQYYQTLVNTYGAVGSEDGTQNEFYSPLDDAKNTLKQKKQIANPSFQNQAIMKKRSINLNSNTDFTAAGVSHMQTKHIPQVKNQGLRK